MATMTSPPSAQREWALYRPGPVAGVTQLQARFVGHVFERHSHDTYAIGVTTGGVQRFTCRGARHDGVPGDLILFNPDEPHDGRAGVDEGFRYAMVYVPPAAFGNMIDEPDGRTRTPCFRWPRVHDPSLGRRLLVALSAMAQGGETLRAQELLAAVLRRAVSRHGGAVPTAAGADAGVCRLTMVREFIDAHHSDDLRIEALARIASLSRAHLTRAFTRAFGVAPHGYLNAVRLRHAQQALLRGQSIAEAAAACGFVDQSHFTRRFKGAFGVPPGAWLAQMRT
jgi:AraC-like DNA-binding protein/quercetin dioxygenase-like cupin family protein